MYTLTVGDPPCRHGRCEHCYCQQADVQDIRHAVCCMCGNRYKLPTFVSDFMRIAMGGETTDATPPIKL